ncbi:MAG: hypothetical protein VX768_16515 [Planctomycetota bacterium]|nr:hypothetical protein [Planctomycetota bacterium]
MPRLNQPANLFRCHLANAKHHASAGEKDRCQLELTRANSRADSPKLQQQLVNACLELTQSPALAISLTRKNQDSFQCRQSLCKSLAFHGYPREAFKIAQQEGEPSRALQLETEMGLSAARAARIELTEQIVGHLLKKGLDKKTLQKIWHQLATSPYKANDFSSAGRYAKRVSDTALLKNLQQAENGPQAEPPEPLDPDAMIKEIETRVAWRKKNPLEAAEYNLGRWNQKAELGRLHFGYARAAAIYQKQERSEQANECRKKYQQAVEDVTKVNPFPVLFEIPSIIDFQIGQKDVRGLKISTRIPPGAWALQAGQVVKVFLDSGDLDSAREIALRLVSMESSHFAREPAISHLLNPLIEMGDWQATSELLQASRPHGYTAIFCEEIGSYLARNQGAKRLELVWGKEIGPFQKAHIMIGAGIAKPR